MTPHNELEAVSNPLEADLRRLLVYKEFKTNKTSILIPLVLMVAHYSFGVDEISDFTKT